MQAAWQGLDASQVWDSHAHLLGTGDSGGGIEVHADTDSLLSPAQYARRLFFLNAGCAHDATGEKAGNVDRAYIERLRDLLEGMPSNEKGGVKLLLLAFERAHDEAGRPMPERSMFYVPDAYARDTARAHARYFEWAASIHPYRPDCVERLQRARADGARAVKWLPAAMNIDPASPRCDAFYESLSKLNIPLITHAGMERAVLGHAQEHGNPLRLRRALEHGVRVVVAHCASLGEDEDSDRGGAPADSFSLFARLMGQQRYEKHLFGDISAMTQLNRAGPALARVIEEEGWHARLLNGSDYPLPGVMPLYSVGYLVSLGLLASAAAPVLTEIRAYNPLLFDFVLKRHLRSGGKRFSPSVFQTKSFFQVESERHVRQ